MDGPALVVDFGTSVTKAGIRGDSDPKCRLSSVVGWTRSKPGRGDIEKPTWLVGEAMKERSFLDAVHPIRHGVVTSWPDMEHLITHVIENELDVEPKNQPVMVCEQHQTPKNQRLKFAELLLESLAVPAVFFAQQAPLALYSMGKMSGLVLDVGDGVTQCVPVFEGYAVPHASSRMNFGGGDLTTSLASLLTESNVFLTSQSQLRTAKAIKEDVCYVALDFKDELKKPTSEIERTYELPDGEKAVIGSERFRCPEGLFDPTFLGHEGDGVHKTILSCIDKSPLDTRVQLYKNVVLTGGSTLFPGFVERLEKDVLAKTPANKGLTVVPHAHRQDAVWIGGSVLASLDDMKKLWVTRESYVESGPQVLFTS